MTSRRRTLDWVLIVALTGCWGVLFARGIAQGLQTGHGQLIVNVSSAPDAKAYPFVVGPTPRQGFEPGDQVEAVDGESLLGSSAVRFYDRATRAARERGFATVRASHNGTPFETRLELTPVPWWWLPMLLAAMQLGAELLLLVGAPQWHLARRNFVMLACLSALNASFDWKVSGCGGRGPK